LNKENITQRKRKSLWQYSNNLHRDNYP